MSLKQINIGGNQVGLSDLDDIFEQVREIGIKDDEHLKNLLFEKVKSKNYVPPKMENIYKEALLEEYKVFTGELKARSRKSDFPEIRVYGAGCSRCEQLDRMTMEIIATKGMAVDYQYVTDIKEITAKGIIGSPTLVINNKVASIGKVPSRKELEKLLMKAVVESGGQGS